MSDGTPKNLTEVTQKIAATPLKVMLDQGPYMIKDFLSQKFGVAYMEAKSEEELERLQKLWNRITEGL